MRSKAQFLDRGPFRAEQLRSGDPYELSNGHAILCMPTGGSGTGPNGMGYSVVGWDPAVKEAGVDTGYSPEPGTLRAPDVAVGNVPNKPGWVPGAPELAIEYADVGQDEKALKEKITKAARERIERCSDGAELDRWVRRAVVVQKVAELFVDE